MRIAALICALAGALALQGDTRVLLSQLSFPGSLQPAVLVYSPNAGPLGALVYATVDPATLKLDVTNPSSPTLKAILPVAPTTVSSVDVTVVNADSQSSIALLKPAPVINVRVFRNGLRMAPSLDYTISGNVVTFISSQAPVRGDVVLVDYQTQ